VAGAVLVAGTVAAAVIWPRRPRRALAVTIAAVALFEAVLFGVYLPRLGRELVGPRAAARALELRRPGEPLVVYKARDDELFFYLPLEARNVRPRSELARLLESGRPFLGVARERDLDRFLEEHPSAAVERVERVGGVDLGHGRHVAIVLFRPAAGVP